MILGVVNKRGVPVILLNIGGVQYRAVIDTGFNGDLELPAALWHVLNPRWEFKSKAWLAGGIEIEEDVYRVEFPFDGRVVEAEATFVEGNEILIGTGMLWNYRLTINFAARTVRIQRARE